MRILIVVPSLNLHTGGPSKTNLMLAKELVSCGQHVEVFSTSWPNLQMETEHSLEQCGVLIRLFPTTSIPGLGHVPYSRTLLCALSDALNRFDMFHAASLWNPLISHTMAMFRKRRVPYAITPHGMMDPIVFDRNRILKYCWAAMWERRNVEQADLMVFNSDREESKARKHGWRLRQTIVLPHSIDLSAGRNLPSRDQLEKVYPQLVGKEVVAFIGRINWVKNLDLLIAAVARLRKQHRNIALLCVGPDNDNHRKGLEKLVGDLGISDLVIFTGMLQDEALQAVYARADVVALVSRKENFGLSVGEALAAGVPVVLSDGVDMGLEWPAPPVWHVEQNEHSIANGLAAALSYSRAVGLPAKDAFELAEREWGISRSQNLIRSYEAIVTARQSEISTCSHKEL